ncbi:MAG: 2-C-methyl-D-erythritol 2,4-cyclodiphosphate synthase [Bacteroidetes bacterium]|nr:2-C-methyl-D-erythritol 2,4-cyclodiphosphate synthase [Bacteroidota bacterium]
MYKNHFFFRTGFGIDIHRLKKGRCLRLGGVDIPHSKAVEAHSDGDVLIHAICDALLGAAGLRDIGYHFPDTSKKYKNIDSRILLKEVVSLLKKEKFRIVNIDSSVCLQKPKISGHIEKMKKVLAGVCGIPVNCISVKATTTEKLGFIGKEEGIAAFAVVLIVKN